MAKDKTKGKAVELRQRAESLLSERVAKVPEVPNENVQKLVHELEVHQIELEIQNGELRQTEMELKESLERSLDLYNLAPVAYLTLGKNNLILQINVAAARLFGAEKRTLLNRKMTEFVAPGSQDAFYFHRKIVLETRSVQTCEIDMLRTDGAPFPVRLESLASTDKTDESEQHRVAIFDITEHKQAEKGLQQAHENLSVVNTKLEERNHQNSILSEMSELLQSCPTIQEMPPIIMNYVAKVFPDTDGALFLLNDPRTALESVARWGDFPEDVNDNIFAPDACWGLRRGRIYVIEDMKTGPICSHLQHPPVLAYICLPLVAKGETVGLLHLRTKASVPGEDSRHMIAEWKDIAVLFSEYLSLSIANIKLWEKLTDQAIRDPLTGLFNRRYMEENIQREFLRAARKQTKIGIVMADIDHFKEFNDAHGHKAGDELLVKLAGFFKRNIRGSDIACRVGGEEFILILPESSPEDTYKRVENLREEVKKMKVYFNDQLLPPISLSMGIATYPDHGMELDELTRVADMALYKAKEHGRDKVVSG